MSIFPRHSAASLRSPIAWNSLLWGIILLLFPLGFPLQVYSGSPYPSLLPYILVGVILLLKVIPKYSSRSRPLRRFRWSWTDIGIVLYILFVLLHIIFQTLLSLTSPTDAVSALVIYALPTILYWYFRTYASEQEITAVLYAIALAGLMVGSFFVYDTYLKIELGQISSYAEKAFEYYAQKAGLPEDQLNRFQITHGYRSFGPLERHSVSAAWIIFGAAAALALPNANDRRPGRFVILLYGSMLLVGMNFTNILAFIIILLLVQFRGFRIIRGRVPRSIGRDLRTMFLLPLLTTLAIISLAGFVLLEYSGDFFFSQSNLILGTGDKTKSFIDIYSENISTYRQHISRYPQTLLVGDGFTKFGFKKGGDVGIIETMARFGIPSFLMIFIGFSYVILSGFKKLEKRALSSTDIYISRLLVFSNSVFLLILINDFHYSIWTSKSVLPILFVALAFSVNSSRRATIIPT